MGPEWNSARQAGILPPLYPPTPHLPFPRVAGLRSSTLWCRELVSRAGVARPGHGSDGRRVRVVQPAAEGRAAEPRAGPGRGESLTECVAKRRRWVRIAQHSARQSGDDAKGSHCSGVVDWILALFIVAMTVVTRSRAKAEGLSMKEIFGTTGSSPSTAMMFRSRTAAAPTVALRAPHCSGRDLAGKPLSWPAFTDGVVHGFLRPRWPVKSPVNTTVFHPCVATVCCITARVLGRGGAGGRGAARKARRAARCGDGGVRWQRTYGCSSVAA